MLEQCLWASVSGWLASKLVGWLGVAALRCFRARPTQRLLHTHEAHGAG